MGKHGLVTISKAAELLTAAGDAVVRSSLSRYVTKYADALNPKKMKAGTVIDFELLVKHRKENIRVEDKKQYDQARGRADEAALNIRAQRQLREIEIGSRLGGLTPTSEVQKAAHEAVAAMRSAFALAVNDAAAAIADATGADLRMIQPHLRAFERVGFEHFVRILAEYNLIDRQA
ncbi:hypothetical protein [Beijerinckia indica]|uniref:Uncharacterized protein n=1 Tax=Beijerinckia indica subsp. indica (strain ATCC 9039 / DSM 1715 / NCIMB 8712) TaxID=395963 RepID=B2ICD1_BEII9|nr:hypothetical protein [Beijerinckia indica]ACB96728.1 hypothetical protein Bind_3167 [Beijerinckia indica subsp. indica ATCC 9039]